MEFNQLVAILIHSKDYIMTEKTKNINKHAKLGGIAKSADTPFTMMCEIRTANHDFLFLSGLLFSSESPLPHANVNHSSVQFLDGLGKVASSESLCLFVDKPSTPIKKGD
jgi:hypothetical protein